MRQAAMEKDEGRPERVQVTFWLDGVLLKVVDALASH